MRLLELFTMYRALLLTGRSSEEHDLTANNCCLRHDDFRLEGLCHGVSIEECYELHGCYSKNRDPFIRNLRACSITTSNLSALTGEADEIFAGRSLEETEGICREGNHGLLLPLFGDHEQRWPNPIRIPLYGLGLLWSFLGVGIISDKFMSSIEVITSKEKTITLRTGQQVTRKIWNPTVSNLTLMALGSSAPEILLSIIETMGNRYFAGDLGPSTIVGSAAFNLLVITAVCIMSIPDGESRSIKEVTVFGVTATFSILAYLWMLIILIFVTPNKIDIGEGITTLLFFPLLVGCAYAVDAKMCLSQDATVVPVESELPGYGHNVKPHETANLLNRVRLKGNSTQESVDGAEREIASLIMRQRRSLAYHRVNAMRSLTGGKRLMLRPQKSLSIMREIEEVAQRSNSLKEIEDNVTKVEFEAAEYHFVENIGYASVFVTRDTHEGEMKVDYHTEAGTAEGGEDFEHICGTLIFKDGETRKEIKVKIIDDDLCEEDEAFTVKITNPHPRALLGPVSSTKIIIMDDDEPGMIGFSEGEMNYTVKESRRHVDIYVSRMGGSSGILMCKARTEPETALPDVDYSPLKDLRIEFKKGEVRKHVAVDIMDTRSYSKSKTFKIILYDLLGPKTDVKFAECIQATVTIVNDDTTKSLVDKVTNQINAILETYRLGSSSFKDQFKDAFTVEGADGEPSKVDYILHSISLPWKLLAATIPPEDILDGWLCFVISLAYIGCTTALIGDLAGLFGCLLGIRDSVTAITLVALGTSLPDTFASMTAAIADDTADSSIVNVTGSNSVNVFLGLGVPWSIASIYWANMGMTTEWYARYGGPDGPGSDESVGNIYQDYREGGYIVPAGDLGKSVAIFTICAVLCLALLLYRRHAYGCELGGPKTPKKISATVLILLWVLYLILSTI